MCASIGSSCGQNSDCCTNNCSGGHCAAVVGATCTTLGNSCTGNGDCCSQLCSGNKCTPAGGLASCLATGDICFQAGDCCTGVCNIASGASAGTCGTLATMGSGGCFVDGEPCSSGTNCCSRLCVPTAAGGHVCQVASGCRVVGDLCHTPSDCCGAPGSNLPGDGNVTCSIVAGTNPPLGTCRNPMGCNPEGDVCGGTNGVNARQDCCGCIPGPTKPCCKPDANGVNRCYGGYSSACPTGYTGQAGCCIAAGSQCTFSSECCNGAPCVPDASGVLRCGSACVAQGAACSATADCCTGLICILAPGQPKGTCEHPAPPPPAPDGGAPADGGSPMPACALPGQSCSPSSTPCCGGSTCTAPGGAGACGQTQTGCTCITQIT
jgi:hypothetical protein